jgi:UDPglucose 6-dehydrogenase
VSSIGVLGSGYVGLTTGACLAHLGHRVICADIDLEKVSQLSGGIIPIIEDGLADLVREGLANGRLSFTDDVAEAAKNAEFVFLCVPTPQGVTGEADLTYIEIAAQSISQHLLRGAVVINKSTVPVGSTRVVESALRRPDIRVVSNPEFLREGTAVHDFLNPDRIVVGCDDQEVALNVASLYGMLKAPIVVTDSASAELIKYAANAFLATKISFVNAIATICEGSGADMRDVVRGMGYDTRIGHEFLKPGPGWGGSCFPKDTTALVHIARQFGYEFKLLEEVINANQAQFDRVADRIVDGLRPGDRVAVWGLTFKALTDDMRESPAIAIIRRILERDFRISAFDPTVKSMLREIPEVEIADSELRACEQASVLAVLTEWENFRWVEPVDVAMRMRVKRVVDARNLLDRSTWKALGFDYQAVGRK